MARVEKAMDISEHLSAADVMLDPSVRNRQDLLKILATDAAGRLGRPMQEIFDALQSREKLGSTALGNGVALPHAQLPGAVPPIVLFVRLPRPIDFEARDEEPVDLVIMVLWPEADPKGLLDAMSEICRALRNPQLLRRLRVAETPDDVAQLLGSHGASDPTQRVRDREEK